MTTIATFKYVLIYIFAIPDEGHKGMLKIGQTTVDAKFGEWLEPNCEELNNAAKKRIDEEVVTAAVPYQLLHTEIAYYKQGEDFMVFNDKRVHAVLEASGYSKATFPSMNSQPQEWYHVDLDTAIKAIHAVKEGRQSLNPEDHKKAEPTPKPKIIFRDEQNDAINRTLTRFQQKGKMLWHAKMRFGKTLCTLEVLRKMNPKRALIITHRPTVRDGWFKDFGLLPFGPNWYYSFHHIGEGQQFDPTREKPLKVAEELVQKSDAHFIYFASIQDLRGSWGKDDAYTKNKDVFATPWDILIVDEAHEGTRTELGQRVITSIQKSNPEIRTLYLSGTPYNMLADFSQEEIYSWTYEMEQQAKADWENNHPAEPNPYADLPRLEVHTYKLDEFADYQPDQNNDYFNFAEFFRVEDEKFIHEDDVKRFLDLLCDQSKPETCYPYSTEAFRYSLSHTLWVVPGVKAAAALSKMIQKHPVLKEYTVVNVAGEGDELAKDDIDAKKQEKLEKDALRKVQTAIATSPKTITLSCGRLTTGVSIPEWSGVFMLCGGEVISAAFYLQTIFRAQTATRRNVMPKKSVCYAFDFAPDRILMVINDMVHHQSHHSSQAANIEGIPMTEAATERAYEDVLRFYAIIAHEGSRERNYDTVTLMQSIGRAYADHVMRRGFRDKRMFVDLGKLTDDQRKAIQEVGLKMQKAGHVLDDPSGSGTITLSSTFPKDKDPKGKGEKKNGKEKGNKAPSSTPRGSKKDDPARQALAVLTNIYVRMPMLVFGADIPQDEDITLRRLLEIVDDESLEVFMPKGVGRKELESLLKAGVLNEEIFASASKMVRQRTIEADSLSVTERTKAIAEMIANFRFPDKETVLTPWRVVNMHLSDTIGGYDFFDTATHRVHLEEPKLISQEGVTENWLNAPDLKVLEINSKSGLYPLWLTYTIFRHFKDHSLFPLDTQEENYHLWRKVVARNVYVLCKSEMSAMITRRVLLGYQSGQHHVRSWYDTKDLIEDVKKNPSHVVTCLRGGYNFWDTNPNDMKTQVKKDLKFTAIVGNPPYQIMDGGAGASAKPIYQEFVVLAKKLEPPYISMIMPSRWLSGGRGLKEFREDMLRDSHMSVLHDYTQARDCFPNVEIKGGICYFLWASKNIGPCLIYNHHGAMVESSKRDLLSGDNTTFVRTKIQSSILGKVQAKGESNLSQQIKAGRFFGFHTKLDWDGENGQLQTADGKSTFPVKHEKENTFTVKVYVHGGECWIEPSNVTRNFEYVGKFKILLPRSGNPNSIIIGNPRIAEPGSCSSNTFAVWLPQFGLNSQKEAERAVKYCKTKFFRVLVLTKSFTQMLSPAAYEFVPVQDFASNEDIDWSKSVREIDRQLYQKYGLNDEEVAFIEKMIKEM
ncbi:MAG: Eco57I restriction-modification methylase domain-containing protein [Bacteroidales bacterium]|nr:Eco57I restriction-modification methylase domain-containing protein [Bacteroidales bacterium]